MSTEEEQNIINELDAQFGAAVADIPLKGTEQLPKMKVVLTCENAFINRSGNSGRKQFVATCKILESDTGQEFIGKTYKKNWGLETAENWGWLKRDMASLELAEPAKPSDLLQLAQQLIGLCFTASMVPNDDEAFPPNCYINKGARRHDLEGGTTASPGAANSL